MDKEPIEIVIDIIRRYMGLSNQQIWQYNLQKDVANNKNLYIILHYLSSVAVSSVSKFELIEIDEEEVGQEAIFSTTKELYRVEIASFDRSAILRKEEVLHSIKAGYSQEMQAEYGFRIFPLTNFNNVSTLKGGKMLNRFMMDLNLLVSRKSVREIDYYDNFPFELNS
jgi:hypothetical protein